MRDAKKTYGHVHRFARFWSVLYSHSRAEIPPNVTAKATRGWWPQHTKCCGQGTREVVYMFISLSIHVTTLHTFSEMGCFWSKTNSHQKRVHFKFATTQCCRGWPTFYSRMVTVNFWPSEVVKIIKRSRLAVLSWSGASGECTCTTIKGKQLTVAEWLIIWTGINYW